MTKGIRTLSYRYQREYPLLKASKESRRELRKQSLKGNLINETDGSQRQQQKKREILSCILYILGS